MKKIIILTISILILVSSCGPGQLMTSGIPPDSIGEITIINPVTSILLIKKGLLEPEEYDDSLTLRAEENVLLETKKYLSDFFLINDLKLDLATQEIVDNEVFQMVSLVKSNRRIENIPFPPTIGSIMQSKNIDYAVCILHVGFTREKGSLATQIALGAALDLLTEEENSDVVKAESNLTICILDRPNSNIAFFNHNYQQGSEPIKKKVTDMQIHRIFKKYLEAD